MSILLKSNMTVLAVLVCIVAGLVIFGGATSADEGDDDEESAVSVEYTAAGVSQWMRNDASDADRWQIALTLFGLWTQEQGRLTWQYEPIPRTPTLYTVSGKGDAERAIAHVAEGNYVLEVIVSDDTADYSWGGSAGIDDLKLVDSRDVEDEVYTFSDYNLEIITFWKSDEIDDGYGRLQAGRITFDVDVDDDESWLINLKLIK